MNKRTLLTFVLAMCVIGLNSILPAAWAADNIVSPLPKDLEIALALSAAPEHWQPHAAVYTLDPAKGYELTKQGTGQYACLVGRTNWRRPGYSDDLLIPICWDKPGMEAIMPVRFEIESLRAQGLSKSELTATIQTNFQNGAYKAPPGPGYSPMLSPLLMAFAGPDIEKPIFFNYPHLMFYAPGIKMEDIGGRQFADPEFPWVLGDGSPHAYIMQSIGASEREARNQKYQGLIASLCALNDLWCMPPKRQ